MIRYSRSIGFRSSGTGAPQPIILSSSVDHCLSVSRSRDVISSAWHIRQFSRNAIWPAASRSARSAAASSSLGSSAATTTSPPSRVSAATRGPSRVKRLIQITSQATVSIAFQR